jgi:hypothetical protein
MTMDGNIFMEFVAKKAVKFTFYRLNISKNG